MTARRFTAGAFSSARERLRAEAVATNGRPTYARWGRVRVDVDLKAFAGRETTLQLYQRVLVPNRTAGNALWRNVPGAVLGIVANAWSRRPCLPDINDSQSAGRTLPLRQSRFSPFTFNALCPTTKIGCLGHRAAERKRKIKRNENDYLPILLTRHRVDDLEVLHVVIQIGAEGQLHAEELFHPHEQIRVLAAKTLQDARVDEHTQRILFAVIAELEPPDDGA